MRYASTYLNTPIEYLKGVGPLKGDLLRKELDIHYFGDLLMHFPFRYVDKTSFVKINAIAGQTDAVQIIARVIQQDTLGEGAKKRYIVTVADDTGELELVWFKGIAWVQKTIAIGQAIVIYGKPSFFMGTATINHPEIESYENFKAQPRTSFDPVYNTTEKLKAKSITSKTLNQLVKTVIAQLQQTDVPDYLPPYMLTQLQLIDRYNAVKWIHAPVSNKHQQAAMYRLKFEELFVQQMHICRIKLNRSRHKGFVFSTVGETFNNFYNNYLPFPLTEDQKKVIKEIRKDTATGYQMNRLLQGDVGSGKTIVALISMLIALDNNYQTCLVAPTEILSQQHFAGIQQLVQKMDLPIALYTGSIKGKQRKQILEQLADGSIKIVIGTHALLEESVVFKNLGLAVIDEQHRFGVAQRAAMWKKNTMPPHILVMTATPIPRTLAMTSYGDLEVSTITTLPPGRKPIQTIHKAEMYRLSIFEFLKKEIALGRQVYIVYPLIEESEKLDYENLMQGFEHLKNFFPEHSYKISMVHGRQPWAEREVNMQRFVQGITQIMVATTVIEVGVNVPNASVMLIESAERFGLSQLHQLRGRVGRGAEKSYCILLSGNKVSKEGKARLQIMVEETNGFKISEKDLEIRGPGDIDGTRQSGAVALKLANIVQDVAIVEQARAAALLIIDKDPNLELEVHYNLKQILMQDKNRSIWQKIA
jgi:ATP-dependent DNA helicase RecG